MVQQQLCIYFRNHILNNCAPLAPRNVPSFCTNSRINCIFVSCLINNIRYCSQFDMWQNLWIFFERKIKWSNLTVAISLCEVAALGLTKWARTCETQFCWCSHLIWNVFPFMRVWESVIIQRSWVFLVKQVFAFIWLSQWTFCWAT